MDNFIVEKILKEGIRSVNLSMLDDKKRQKILDSAAERLFRQNRFQELIEIILMCNDMEKLNQLGDLLMQESKTVPATMCYLHTKDKQRLNNAALKCIQSQNYRLAAQAYETAGNMQMALFIKKNFT